MILGDGDKSNKLKKVMHRFFTVFKNKYYFKVLDIINNRHIKIYLPTL